VAYVLLIGTKIIDLELLYVQMFLEFCTT